MSGLLNLQNDPLWQAGIGLLAGNQRSNTPTSPFASMQNSLMAGQKARQDLTEQQIKQKQFDLEQQYKMAQIAQMNQPAKRDRVQGADGYQYYVDDGSRVLPNVQAAPTSEPEIIKVAKQLYPNDQAAQNKFISDVKLKPSTTITNDMKLEAEANKPLTSTERDAYRMADGSPLPVGVTMNEIKAMGDKVVPIDKRVEDTQKVFNEAYAEADQTLGKVESSLGVYRDILKTSGTKIIPDGEKLKLKAAHTDLQMQMKDIFELGVLTGPDMDLLESIAIDPTSVMASYIESGEPDALDKQLQLIQDKIDRERGIAKRVYKQKYTVDDLLKKYGN